MGKLYLKLDQTSWNFGDFSTESKITGTIYTDKAFTVPKDLTDFTVYLRMFKRWHRMDRFGKQASVVSGINGTFEYAVNQGDIPFADLYLFEAELNKLGIVESTVPVEFYIKQSPPHSDSTVVGSGSNSLLLEDGGNLILE